jgi:cytochrome d ubiquinol oxidase subunit II
MFSLGSLLIALVLGMAAGALIQGIPLDAEHEFIGDYTAYINWYSLLIGIFGIATFNMHGSIYVLMKTEGALHDKMRQRVVPSMIFFIMLYALSTVATLIYMPHMSEAIKERPMFFLIAAANMFAIANIPREINRGYDYRAFACSCLNIICLLALYGVGTYPNVVRASNDPAHLSLTIWNSASSQQTLEILLLIAILGIPLVISYTIAIYTIFHGKVKLDSSSY